MLRSPNVTAVPAIGYRRSPVGDHLSEVRAGGRRKGLKGAARSRKKNGRVWPRLMSKAVFPADRWQLTAECRVRLGHPCEASSATCNGLAPFDAPLHAVTQRCTSQPITSSMKATLSLPQ